MTERTLRAVWETFPFSSPAMAQRSTMERMRYTRSTMMSHMSGELRFEYTKSSQTLCGPPRSTITKPIAATVQQMAVQTAILEMFPKPSMPKALGMELMMRPPADRPTKNMKFVM